MVAIDTEEDGENVGQARRLKLPVVIGRGANPAVLRRLSLDRARALAAVTAEDLVNIEAAMAARSISEDLRVVLRAGDGEVADETRSLLRIGHVIDVHRLGAAYIAAAALGSDAEGVRRTADGRATLLLADGGEEPFPAALTAGTLRTMAIEDKDTEDLSVAPIVGPDDPRRFTDSGIEIQPLYGPDDLPEDLDLGEPGEFPFTRGIHREMYRKRQWTMRQYAGYASAKESNERYKYLLKHGSTGLSMAFDLPTQLGLDSDDPRCLGEVGRTGVAIDTLEDMRMAFDGIPLDEVSTSMTINAPASVLLLLYELVAEEQGVASEGPARHGPERHPQGVHRARELHLPARAVDAADHGPVRLLHGAHPEVEHGVDLRLPLPREGLLGRPGGRVHARQRHGLRAGGARRRPRGRRLRAPPGLLLQRPQQRLPGGREVPRRPQHVGARDEGALRRAGPEARRRSASTPRPAASR